MTIKLVLALLALAEVTVAAGVAPSREGRYRVRYDLSEPSLVFVEAELPAARQRLTIGENRPHPKEHRFGDYVDNLVVRTLDGSPIEFERDGRDAWKLIDPGTDRVLVNYTLRVEHDEVGWSPSHAEVAFARDRGVFLRGWTLLLFGDNLDAASVRFEPTGGARAFCTLAPDADEPGLYLADSRQDAAESGIFLGAPQYERFVVGGVEVELVVANDLPGAHEVMREPLAEALRAATDYFGSPAVGRYVVFASRSPYPLGSGSGFQNGMSMLFEHHPEDEPGGMWLHTLVHELVHTWNGVALQRVGSDEEWFNEGFTNYVAIHLTGRNDLSSPSWRRTYFAEKWVGYLAGISDIPMTTAGRNKGRHSDLLYGGGMAVALLFDLWIREDSSGERTLADLFRKLLADHERTGRPFSTADVQRSVQGLVERDLTPFFERHVYGTEPIDPASFLVPMGLTLESVETEQGPRTELRLDSNADGRWAFELLGIE